MTCPDCGDNAQPAPPWEMDEHGYKRDDDVSPCADIRRVNGAFMATVTVCCFHMPDETLGPFATLRAAYDGCDAWMARRGVDVTDTGDMEFVLKHFGGEGVAGADVPE